MLSGSSDNRYVNLTRAGALLAIVFFFSTSILSATLFDGSYSPVENFISDLGNVNKNPSGHLIFDSGCVLSGLAIIFFVYGLSKSMASRPNQVRRIGVSRWLGYFMGISIAMVGVFSSDLGAIHLVWATCFFVLLIVYMLTMNFALKTNERYPRSVFYYVFGTVIVGLSYVLTFALGFPSPLLEWLSVIFGLMWIGFIGILVPRLTMGM